MSSFIDGSESTHEMTGQTAQGWAYAVDLAPDAAEHQDRLRVVRALRDADCCALAAVLRVSHWIVREVDDFMRDTGAAPEEVFQPGLVRGVLGLSAEQGQALAARAIDRVALVALTRMRATPLRGPMGAAGICAGADRTAARAFYGFAAAGRRARRRLSVSEAGSLLSWAIAERRHADAIRPRRGTLSSAMTSLWTVKCSAGARWPRPGVDETRWRGACARTFGVDHIPPGLMARLTLESLCIDMGLPAPSITWPPRGVGSGVAVFTHASNPALLAEKLAGHDRFGARHRHLFSGAPFVLTVRFTVRDDELAEVVLELEIPGCGRTQRVELTPAATSGP